MPRWAIIAGGALLLLLAVTWGVSVVDRDTVRRALRAASERYGLPPEWLDAIGRIEGKTPWQLDSVNLYGPDGERGGAYGPTQLTTRTARAYGYTGDMLELTRNPDLAAEWSALYLSRGSPRDYADAIAWWNAGKYHGDADLSGELEPGEAPSSTVDTYWPRASAALAYVEANPPPPEDAAP